ncbi:sigma-70 family RNA polymerase sigma factor [Sphingobacterium phlebotomi]|uniref:Sigma-70 family RNA polymerase sigma factor n=1 Tax=Sphingobacterium phlebotomi TaxID=2605433 RepID=A0A5D4H7A0_9SPHI|nr:sigma-70 family RNA polymerase sigma factor [Sphingobacterium phlebotomi]TYR35325.1 sigma-70 family RNA polymerase sigma factor [Sphingobacterium phlebotomi]
MKEVSETVLADFRAGYSNAFRIIFEMYHQVILQYVYGFCHHREEAEETTQDTFTQLFIYRNKIHGAESILPFLYAVSKRIAISHFRRKVIREEALGHIGTLSNRNPHDTQEAVLIKELNDSLHKIIEELPQQQRKVFVLNKMEDLSCQEIADQLAISKNTVKNHLAVATKTVRIKLQRLICFFLIF